MKNFDDRVDLKALDPASLDPGFWTRFHGRVMTHAREELARRRMAGEQTVAEVVFRWRRVLVPSALLAATLAGIFVIVHEEPRPGLTPLALEEALVEDLDGSPIPAVLGTVAELDEVAFLRTAGGF